MLGEELVDVSLDDGGLAGAEFSDHQDLVQVLLLLHTSCLQSTKKSINRMCTVQELILILSPNPRLSKVNSTLNKLQITKPMRESKKLN